MNQIDFTSEEIDFSLNNESSYIEWINTIAQIEGKSLDSISYIFCSDDYLLGINQQFLDHDYYTDIITFNNSLDQDMILADIFISIDRVKENAVQYQVSFDHELKRVMAHGVLHLCGYNDKTEAESEVMRKKEDACISLLK